MPVDVRDREALRAWLKTQPREAVVLFAARAAARAAPVLVDNERDPLGFPRVLLPALRALATARLAATWPSRAQAAPRAAYAARAADVAARDARAYAYADAAHAAAADAAAAAGRAAAYAADAGAAAAARAAAADAAAAAAARAAAYDSAAAAGAAAYDAAAAADLKIIDNGGANALARAPLWHDRAPRHAHDFVAFLRRAKPDFDVWAKWYDDILAGRVGTAEQALAYIEFTEEDWGRGPDYVNSVIKLRLAERDWAKDEPEPPKADPEVVRPRPAAYDFDYRDGRLEAIPAHPDRFDRALAEALRSEALAKARDLLDRLRKTNADLRPIGSIERMIETLDVPVEALNVGLLLSRSRSIEADRIAYDSDEGRAALFPGALAAIADLDETLKDLRAAFPLTRAIETERLRIEIAQTPGAVEAIREGAARAAEVAEASPIVAPEVAEALRQFDAAIQDEKNVEKRQEVAGDALLVEASLARGLLRAVHGAGVKTLSGARKVAGELAGLGKDSWKQVRERFPRGVGAASELAPWVMLLLLVGMMNQPLALALAAAGGLKSLVEQLKKEAPSPGGEAAADGEEAGEDGKPAKRKRPAKKKPADGGRTSKKR